MKIKKDLSSLNQRVKGNTGYCWEEIQKFKRVLALIALSGFYSISGFSSETSERLGNPFLLPQTNIVIGSAAYQAQISGWSILHTGFQAPESHTFTFPLNSADVNSYGFEMEVNHSRYLNIGAFLRYNSQSAVCEISKDSQSLGSSKISYTTGVVGGYTRFFLVPNFLRGRWIITSLFARLELGGGPMVIGSEHFVSGGLTAQGGAHLGIESYFTKWVGIGLSYGRIFELGKGTVGTFKDGSNVWSMGSVFQLSLKTTLF